MAITTSKFDKRKTSPPTLKHHVPFPHFGWAATCGSPSHATTGGLCDDSVKKMRTNVKIVLMRELFERTPQDVALWRHLRPFSLSESATIARAKAETPGERWPQILQNSRASAPAKGH